MLFARAAARRPTSSLRAKLGGLLLLPALRGLRDRIDPETYGGAYLLGVRGISVIAHGNSSRAARSATPSRSRPAASSTDVVDRMAQRLAAAAAGTDLQDGGPVKYSPAVPDPENGESST